SFPGSFPCSPWTREPVLARGGSLRIASLLISDRGARSEPRPRTTFSSGRKPASGRRCVSTEARAPTHTPLPGSAASAPRQMLVLVLPYPAGTSVATVDRNVAPMKTSRVPRSGQDADDDRNNLVSLRTLLAIGLVLPASACLVGPDFVKPKA